MRSSLKLQLLALLSSNELHSLFGEFWCKLKRIKILLTFCLMQLWQGCLIVNKWIELTPAPLRIIFGRVVNIFCNWCFLNSVFIYACAFQITGINEQSYLLSTKASSIHSHTKISDHFRLLCHSICVLNTLTYSLNMATEWLSIEFVADIYCCSLINFFFKDLVCCFLANVSPH